MQNSVGAIITIAACLVLLALLAWPYAIRSTYDINTYYRSGVVNPMLAGVLVAFAAIRVKYVSAEVGTEIGLGLISFFIEVMWAVTARIDVFRAPDWIVPV